MSRTEPGSPDAPAAAAQPRREPPRSGIANIDKPPAMTSHDVVQAVRRAAGVRRVGHAGTLDPLATGVLLVCLGSATRVIDELQAGRKQYRAELRLGVETTTFDREGDVVAEREASGVTAEAIEAALGAWRGEVLQTPPMFSAVHHQGRRLYELARQGVTVDRAPRPVSVYRLEVVEWSPPALVLDLAVSKGTYVRALAHDIGRSLGVGAHLAALRRTAVGAFTADEAEPLARVIEAFEQGWWPHILHPLDAALAHLAAVVVDGASVAAIRQGRQVAGAPAADSAVGQRAPGAMVRAYDTDGRFVGVLRWDAVTACWQPDRVFPPAP